MLIFEPPVVPPEVVPVEESPSIGVPVVEPRPVVLPGVLPVPPEVEPVVDAEAVPPEVEPVVVDAEGLCFE